MGVLAPAAGMQALAAILAAAGPLPAVLSAAPILWEVVLRPAGGKTIPPLFADFVQTPPLANTASKVCYPFL